MNRHRPFSEVTKVEAWVIPALPFALVAFLLVISVASLAGEEPRHPASPVAYLLK